MLLFFRCICCKIVHLVMSVCSCHWYLYCFPACDVARGLLGWYLFTSVHYAHRKICPWIRLYLSLFFSSHSLDCLCFVCVRWLRKRSDHGSSSRSRLLPIFPDLSLHAGRCSQLSCRLLCVVLCCLCCSVMLYCFELCCAVLPLVYLFIFFL